MTVCGFVEGIAVNAALPLRAKLLYASSSLGGEALSQSRGLWLLYFYSPPEDANLERQLPRLLVGVLLVAGRVLEALDDALIGYWSDRTRSRWGRRIPFIVLATPLWALFGAHLHAAGERNGLDGRVPLRRARTLLPLLDADGRPVRGATSRGRAAKRRPREGCRRSYV